MNRDSIISVLGRFIDLDRIVSISDAHFINNMGSGGYFTKFTVTMQLCEKPLEFWAEVRNWETHFKSSDGRTAAERPDRSTVNWWEVFMLPNTKGELVEVLSSFEEQNDLQCVADMQKIVDGLVIEWRDWKSYRLDRQLG
jgi:hypothetical protein